MDNYAVPVVEVVGPAGRIKINASDLEQYLSQGYTECSVGEAVTEVADSGAPTGEETAPAITPETPAEGAAATAPVVAPVVKPAAGVRPPFRRVAPVAKPVVK